MCVCVRGGALAVPGCMYECVGVYTHTELHLPCVCPQVYEAMPCHSQCKQYEWRAEPWSMCTINTVDELPACGEGVQSRKIRSV